MSSLTTRTRIPKVSVRRLIAVCATLLALAAIGFGQQAVTTYQYNIQRTGLNSSETILTQSNVNQNTFGLLFTLPVDGQVYAQPLYVPGVTVAGVKHNVVYVCTEHNSVYAFDADTFGSPLWQVNLGPSVPDFDTGCSAINPEIGITGTPVINLTGTGTGYIYVVAKNKQTVNGNPTWSQSIHALNIASGAEMTGSPVVIQASVLGTGEGTDGTHVAFNALIQHQRPGLLLLNGVVYIAWASHGDDGPYHGWIIGYNASTLAQTTVFNTTPNALNDPSGYPIAAGGIWQSGAALASDGTYIYCATGNGLFNVSNGSYGDSILKLATSGGISVADYFTPSNQQNLDDNDLDLGSGGVVLLPSSVGSSTYPNLLTQCGKDGTMRLVSTDNLGQFNSTTDQVPDALPNQLPEVTGDPAYFNGNVYYGSWGAQLDLWSVVNAKFTTRTVPVKLSANYYNYPGPTPAVSANGTQNGIVWCLENDGFGKDSPAVLWAYNAATLATLYSSNQSPGRDSMPPPIKFTTPMIENGKVYCPTSSALCVFGIGKWVAPPVADKADGAYPGPISVNVTDATPGAKIYYTTDGTVPTQSSTQVTGPITISTSTTLLTKAFATGYSANGPTSDYYQIAPVIGTGTGLTGNYYNNMTLTAPAAFTRVNKTVNFNWNGVSPGSGVGAQFWSAEWTGDIQAETTGAYFFRMEAQDGIRLFVNGVELIDDWTDHGPSFDVSDSINLVAGQKYSIVVEYYQDTGDNPLTRLYSSAPGLNWQVIPETQLYYSGFPLTGLTVSPSSLYGAYNTAGVVRVASAAGSGGDAISLTSSSADVQVPATVTVPSGKTAYSFTITTSAVSAPETVTVTATYSSVSVNTTVTLNPYPVSSFSVSPNTVTGRYSTAGVVRLSGKAGSGGDAVSLSSSSGDVQVPATVTVPAGDLAASFTITTSAVSTSETVTLTATFGGVSKQTTLQVNPYLLSNFYASPATVTGRYSTSGVVQLLGNAGPSGDVVTLSSGSADAQVPATVTVPAGRTGVSFTITTSAVSASENVTLTATFGTSSEQTTLTLNPYLISNFYVSPTSVKGGTNTAFVVQLAGPAGPNGNVISLSSANSHVTVPATVTVPAGKTGVSMSIATSAVTTTTQVVLTATFGSSSKQATVTLTP